MGVTLSERCSRAIRAGLDFLSQSQLPTGELKTLVGPEPDLKRDAKRDPSIFTTVNVATSLLEVSDSRARNIVACAADFLSSEMLPGGLWRFWTKAHPGSFGMPPDVDDTVCVSEFLGRLGRAFPDNRKILLSNRCRDGRFLTWITPRAWHLVFAEGRAFLAASFASRRGRKLYFESGPQPPEPGNIDCVVNANAVSYFEDCRDCAQATAWVSDIVQSGRAATHDRWYQSEAALLYAVARGCVKRIPSFCRLQPVIAAKALELQPSCHSALETALVACTLNLVAPASPQLLECIHTLLGTQEQDGGWLARVYYYDSFKCALCWGSKELTSGFCLEALGRFLRR